MTWTRDPLAARRAERDRLLALARGHADALARRIPVDAAAVAGSVARGDFNVWSDVDLVVVSAALPPDARERHDLLNDGRPGRLEIHGYTPQELDRARAGGDALAREAVESGVVLRGRWPG